MELLKFIFRDFWTFIGFMVILYFVGDLVLDTVKLLIKKKQPHGCGHQPTVDRTDKEPPVCEGDENIKEA